MNERKICDLWNKIPLDEISKLLDIDQSTIIRIWEANGLNKTRNKNIFITKFEEQIILSGIIGDGRLKVNGKLGNVYYSECHALDEKEYCIWKRDNLGMLTKNSNIYPKNLHNNSSDAIEFCTVTTPSLKKYFNMSKKEIICKLDTLGLTLLLLDDGWYSPHSKKGNFMLSTGTLDKEEINLLLNQYNENGFTNVHLIGIKRKDIAFCSCDNKKIFKYIIKYIPVETDIIQKKFKNIMKRN